MSESIDSDAGNTNQHGNSSAGRGPLTHPTSRAIYAHYIRTLVKDPPEQAPMKYGTSNDGREPQPAKFFGVSGVDPTRYFFSLDATLNTLPEGSALESLRPDGLRLHAVYEGPSNVETDAATYKSCWEGADAFDKLYSRKAGNGLDNGPSSNAERDALLEQPWTKQGWTGIRAKVLNGMDFITVRSDGVLLLDGRITLRTDDDVVIDATYQGMIDLEKYPPPTAPHKNGKLPVDARRSTAFEAFWKGGLSSTTLPIGLSIRFELSTGPWSITGTEDTSWAPPAPQYAWRYASLTRQQFIAGGTLTFEAKTGGLPRPNHIRFDVVGSKPGAFPGADVPASDNAPNENTG